MDEVRAHLDAHDGVVSSARLSALGQSPGQVRRLVVSGTLVRLRRSAFVDGDRWRAASPWERHELRARAVATSLCVPGSPYALSHHSALCVMGVGVYAVDERVHLVRTDGRRGRGDDTLHVHPPVPPRWVSPHRGLPVVRPELACLQVAAAFGVVAGLVSTDAALRQDLVDRAALEAARPLVVGRGSPRADTVLQHATPLSGSGGETRCRWVMHTLGLPNPQLQVPIRDAAGDLVGVVDFLFADARTIVEFDGALKYGSREDLLAEKRREDRLRQLGYEVVRVTWADLAYPDRIAARVAAAFARAAARRRPGA